MTSARLPTSNSAGEAGQPSPNGDASGQRPPGRNGTNGVGPRNGNAPVLRHIKDLLEEPDDIDPNTSIKRLLEMAEQSLRQADSSLAFNRPDVAFGEFVKASIIAVKFIRRHPDYVDMKETRPELAKIHMQVLGKIGNQQLTFEKIKQEIMADNRKTGVQPTPHTGGPPVRPPPNGVNHHRATHSLGANPPTFSQEKTNGSVKPASNGIASKPKPPVHPKPQSLHGNAVQHGHSRTSSANGVDQDLMARIERLRGSKPLGTQDSRIKTYPIQPPKPAGPREMPSSKPDISIDTSAPNFPRAPDAIYSPARGNVLPDSGKLPSSSSARGPFHRTNSAASVTSTPGALQRTQSNGYFSLPIDSPANAVSLPSRSRTKVPEGDLITPVELFNAMKAEGTILVIDVRNREDFNDGHIMTSPIICIEPSILLRPEISASDISESLILAPDNEQEIFDKRDQYDLVVFYDRDSQGLPLSRRSSDDAVIFSLRQVLVDFNYDHPLKNPPPKLLRGGLYAWMDLMGPQSLRVISPESSRKRGPPRPMGSPFVARRPSKYAPAKWKAREVERWNETISHEEEAAASSPAIVRSTEEFLKRYPPVSPLKESMTSPVQGRQWPAYGSSHQNDLHTELPTPPARPPPALSRLSHVGVTQEHHVEDAADTTMTAPKTQFYTGLRNPHVWCYANSVVQSLLASPGFGEELANTKCTDAYHVPRKQDEKIDNPQLLTRIMSNLFHWMNSGKFQVMQAETLMNYSKHVVNQSRSAHAFGGNSQQDADEYLSFLLDQLDDETNVHRDRSNSDVQPQTRGRSLLQAAWEYWNTQLSCNQSIVDRYWRGVELQTTRCLECRKDTYRFSPVISLALQLNESIKRISLDQVFRDNYVGDHIDGFECSSCIARTGNKGYRTKAHMTTLYPRLPQLLRVSFKCYTETSTKINTMIDWDYDNIDLSWLTLPAESRGQANEVTDPGFLGSFRYQCYAVVLHQGSTINSGHYIAYVRDRRSRRGPSEWLRCNDVEVSPMRVSSPNSDAEKDRRLGFVPYMALFQRK